jgi:glycosyl transferase family 21
MDRNPICTYLLPLRRSRFSPYEANRLAEYFQILNSCGCEILVVDGSPANVFAQNAVAWNHLCRHERVDRRFGYLNDKVNGIHTGMQCASCDQIILADDDIRYTSSGILTIVELLHQVEVVRPQNFLAPLPWWGKLEAARMLINRAILRTADYPGTCAFRRATMLSAGHYDGDVLFDNEELIRHFASHDISIEYANDLFIRKLPPFFRKWLEQRPRQAYEDFGLRGKTFFFLALLPVAIIAPLVFGSRIGLLLYGIAALTSIMLAWIGRAKGAAAQFFPASTCLFAPLWICERTLSTYWALYWYFIYGGYPFGDTILSKGIGRDWKRGGRIASLKLRRQQ